MTQILFSLFTGIIVGALFAYLRFPIPAPPNLAGVMGIVGIYLGYLIISYWKRS